MLYSKLPHNALIPYYLIAENIVSHVRLVLLTDTCTFILVSDISDSALYTPGNQS